MELHRLDPLLRRNLKNLLQGYMEHCEVSRHLMARIDFPIYYHGFKFGAPVFTHVAEEGRERPVWGMVGFNDPRSQVPSEIVLQFIEILTLKPDVAGAAVLRMLPVANPVALELEEDAPAMEDWDLLQHMVEEFRGQSPDGFVELAVAPDGVYRLEGTVPPSWFEALERVREEGGAGDEGARVAVPEEILLQPQAEPLRWEFRLSVPGSWTAAQEILGVARFLARWFEVHSSAWSHVTPGGCEI